MEEVALVKASQHGNFPARFSFLKVKWNERPRCISSGSSTERYSSLNGSDIRSVSKKNQLVRPWVSEGEALPVPVDIQPVKKSN